MIAREPMVRVRARLLRSIILPVCLPGLAVAHSASDAYLNLSADAASTRTHVVLHGQWDIALRDLDFLLHLDDDGDGRLTWKEVRRHLPDIEGYAYAHLRVRGDEHSPCTIKPTRQLIDDHADGAYAALFFDVDCPRSQGGLTLQYSLFFAVDPSHRGIFVMHDAGDVATSVLAPDNATIGLR